MATTKVIKYRGASYIVPTWAKFIAMDADGSVFVYAQRPYVEDEYNWMCADDRHGGPTACERVFSVVPEWRESLEEVL